MKDGLRLIATVHRAGQIVEALFEQAVREDQITTRQAHVLAALAECEGKSQTHLSEATGIDRTTLSEICKRLVRKGLVTRRRTRADARAYALQLTPEGAVVVRHAETAAAQVARQLRERIVGLERLRIVTPARDAAE